MAVVEIELRAAGEAGLEQKRAWCAQLEAGAILLFRRTPVQLAEEDITFLLGQQQSDSSLHKNIAYKPATDALSGLDVKGEQGDGGPTATRGDAPVLRGSDGLCRRAADTLRRACATGLCELSPAGRAEPGFAAEKEE